MVVRAVPNESMQGLQSSEPKENQVTQPYPGVHVPILEF